MVQFFLQASVEEKPNFCVQSLPANKVSLGGQSLKVQRPEGPALGLMLCGRQALKLLILCEHGALRFHFTLGLTSYVASLACWTYHSAAQSFLLYKWQGHKAFFLKKIVRSHFWGLIYLYLWT